MWASWRKVRERINSRSTDHSTPSGVEKYPAIIASINHDLDRLHLQVKQAAHLVRLERRRYWYTVLTFSLPHQGDKQRYVTVVNRLDDQQSKLATRLSHAQLAYFRNVVRVAQSQVASFRASPCRTMQMERIAVEDSDDGCPQLSSITVLNLSVVGAAQLEQATQSDNMQVGAIGPISLDVHQP